MLKDYDVLRTDLKKSVVSELVAMSETEKREWCKLILRGLLSIDGDYSGVSKEEKKELHTLFNTWCKEYIFNK